MDKQTAAVMDKRCGTCGWWDLWDSDGWGDCNAPVPSSVESGAEQFNTHESDGTNCPCWKLAEKREEGKP